MFKRPPSYVQFWLSWRIPSFKFSRKRIIAEVLLFLCDLCIHLHAFLHQIFPDHLLQNLSLLRSLARIVQRCILWIYYTPLRKPRYSGFSCLWLTPSSRTNWCCCAASTYQTGQTEALLGTNSTELELQLHLYVSIF